jgi:hypothetical protein
VQFFRPQNYDHGSMQKMQPGFLSLFPGSALPTLPEIFRQKEGINS